MRTGLAAALLMAVCACTRASSPPAGAAELSPAATTVEVVRDGKGWTAEFRFASDAPVWAFTRSPVTRVGERPWRPQSWRVETPGVRLERRGHYDVLAAEGGAVPRRVRVRFTPFREDVLSSYNPALVFSDGSVALFSRQFDAFPVRSLEEAERLPIELEGAGLARDNTRVTWRDRTGKVLHAGRRMARARTLEGGTYIFFGKLGPIATETMTTIIDPQLPGWIRSNLERMTPQIFARYAAELGPPPGERPTVMVSWSGPTKDIGSMTGSVLPSLIVMSYEGDRLAEPSARGNAYGLWFIAHEAAHFWLGQAVRYEFSRDAWITEGGAELLAIRTVAALEPAYDARKELQSRLDECLQLSRSRSVASAQERNEHRAYYACGAMFALVAEAAERRSSGGDFFDVTRRLVDENRTDEVLTKEEWLAELTRLSGDEALARGVRVMIETGTPDPAAAFASLFQRVGVAHSRDSEGRLRVQ